MKTCVQGFLYSQTRISAAKIHVLYFNALSIRFRIFHPFDNDGHDTFANNYI